MPSAPNRVHSAGQGERAATKPDVERVVASRLFDSDWYCEQSGSIVSRRKAAADYLDRGQGLGFTPHPLFDPEYFAQENPDAVAGRDSFVAYLELLDPRAQTHPLFNVSGYIAAYPKAVQYPGGPLLHYAEVGAKNGALPNDWYRPNVALEPGGLVDWIRQRHREWRERSAAALEAFSTRRPQDHPPAQEFVAKYADVVPQRVAAEEPLVSIIVSMSAAADAMTSIVANVQEQTLADWELVVVDDVGGVDLSDTALAGDARVRIVAETSSNPAASLNRGLQAARGTFLAFPDPLSVWRPDHLRLCVCLLVDGDMRGVHPIVERSAGRGERRRREYSAVDVTKDLLLTGPHLQFESLVISRQTVQDFDGFDVSAAHAAPHDLALRMAGKVDIRLAPFLGVRVPKAARRARARANVDAWEKVVLNEHLVDWRALPSRRRRPDVVSVVIPTPDDWRLTRVAVDRVVHAAAGSDLHVQVLIVDNGSRPTAAAVLESLPQRYPGVEVVSSPVNRGFAVGNNIALEHVVGETVVFLNNDTEVTEGWLEPLVSALREPDVLGAQSLLLYPSGTIQSAGVAFPSCGGIPHVLLQGFPVEDAAGIEDASFAALTGAALAMRMDDVLELRGFDALYLNGMEDVDLGLRLRKLRGGRFTVRPDSVVIHHESRSPGRFVRSSRNRRLLLERWGRDVPGDDVALWRGQGFDVVGYSTPSRVVSDSRVAVPQPVLTRRPVASVLERPPRLRWALKNPAPSGPGAEKWGDTHFARRLAVALRTLGQEVVIDHRPEFERTSGQHDDVVLVLRGLAPYAPVYGQVSLVWVISHPEMLRRPELASYDRVFAASVAWSSRMSRQWGVRIDPLLQATDPELFNPDRARPDTGHPVLFVGGSRKQMRPIVRAAVDVGLPLSVYGSEWEKLIPKRVLKGKYFPNAEVGAAYRAAGVVLNDHWEDMRIEGFLSNRLFDATASGARTITDDVAGLGDIFGRSVQVARDADDLRRLATAPDLDEIFGGDEERRAVAQRIHTEHSFEARARHLIDAAAEIWSDMTDSRRTSQ